MFPVDLSELTGFQIIFGAIILVLLVPLIIFFYFGAIFSLAEIAMELTNILVIMPTYRVIDMVLRRLSYPIPDDDTDYQSNSHESQVHATRRRQRVNEPRPRSFGFTFRPIE